MTSASLEKIYKIVRIIIFAVPVFTILLGMYLILFPVESFGYSASQPENSKFEIAKNESQNKISFGVFPTLNHQYIDLSIDFGKIGSSSAEKPTQITIEKTYQAFLYPDGEPIKDKGELRDLLFRDNKSPYPNGSLLHLKPTDEVYLLTDGKKILFPGPEIFRAFGYNFDNLAEVEKSTLDQFPNADDRVFLWTHPHPNGTLFQAYPSHKIYLVVDGKKREIENVQDLSNLWPNYFTIPVDDAEKNNQFVCPPDAQQTKNGKVFCRFDRQKMPSSLGGYYNFALKYPDSCPIAGVNIEKASIRLVTGKTFATVKDSFRSIFASVLNRYFLKQ
ncbi:MAG: hypothetical protein PHP25_04720 [Candidatus Moranbacteria bacterium]|nr:hypothetical protein [Candidatus Moranbacteria bacterium]